MGAFIVAAVVLAITVCIAFIMAFAAGMSTTGQGGPDFRPVLIGGTIIAIAVAASHWLPHIGW